MYIEHSGHEMGSSVSSVEYIWRLAEVGSNWNLISWVFYFYFQM